jgi:hypothetical protein
MHIIHQKVAASKSGMSMQAPAKYFLKSDNNKEECSKKN